MFICSIENMHQPFLYSCLCCQDPRNCSGNLAVLQPNLSDNLNEDDETASKRPVYNHNTLNVKGLTDSHILNSNSYISGIDTVRSDQSLSSTAVGHQTDHLTSSATGLNSYIIIILELKYLLT